MSLLSPEENKYYDDYDDMFSTPGWKQLVKEMGEEIYGLQADSLELPNWDQVSEARGRAKQLAYLLAFESTLENQKEALLESRKEDAEEEADASV